MPSIKRLVLDILKPHHPNPLDFASAIADQDASYRVKVTVAEMDEKTETIVMTIEGDHIRFDAVAAQIANMGGSIHSIDEVEVAGAPAPTA